jgi:hypothetical protein
LAVVERKGENAEASQPWTIRSSNVLDSDYFQSDWPSDARIVDNRDAMHRQGWAYFRVQGNVHGQSVTGVGRMPFVYGAVKQHSPWMRLKVGDTAAVVDGGTAAILQNAQGAELGKYPQGSFFKGLSRPWMGLHAIDSVRRDAAEQRATFETQVLSGGRQAQVTITSDKTMLKYLIDIEADLILQIGLAVDGSPVGTLSFEYLQDAGAGQGEFTAPSNRVDRLSLRENPGLLWLVRLANGHLGG